MEIIQSITHIFTSAYMFFIIVLEIIPKKKVIKKNRLDMKTYQMRNFFLFFIFSPN